MIVVLCFWRLIPFANLRSFWKERDERVLSAPVSSSEDIVLAGVFFLCVWSGY